MRIIRTRFTATTAALVLLAGLLITSFGPAPASAASSVKVSNTTPIPCGFGTNATPTDWYFPATGTPRGLVWLQHGFTENKGHWSAYAPQLAAAGYVVVATTLPTVNLFGCTVSNIGNNTGYLNNIASTFGQAANASGALVTSYNDAARRAGRPGLAFPSAWSFVGHSAGGEAVTYIAQRLRTNHSAAFGRLRGLVLEDPVASFIGTNLSSALTQLNSTALPIFALASPPYSCNNNQSGTVLVEQKLTNRSFHGSQITSGAHSDIFGPAAGLTGTLTCGTPQANNVNAAQTLTSAWIADQLARTRTATFYPGGQTYQALVAAGTITTLP